MKIITGILIGLCLGYWFGIDSIRDETSLKSMTIEPGLIEPMSFMDTQVRNLFPPATKQDDRDDATLRSGKVEKPVVSAVELSRIDDEEPIELQFDPREERDGEPITWQDIEKFAPHYTYEQKLELESLALIDHRAALAQLQQAANYPDSGDEIKDVLFASIGSVSPTVNEFIFVLDGAYQEQCGEPLRSEHIPQLLKMQNDLRFYYHKRNYRMFKREMRENVSCFD